MTSRNRGKKEEVYDKCPEKKTIISKGTLNRESFTKEEADLFEYL